MNSYYYFLAFPIGAVWTVVVWTLGYWTGGRDEARRSAWVELASQLLHNINEAPCEKDKSGA